MNRYIIHLLDPHDVFRFQDYIDNVRGRWQLAPYHYMANLSQDDLLALHLSFNVTVTIHETV